MISKEKALALRQELGIPVVHQNGNVIRVDPFPDEVAEIIAPPFPAEARVFLETYHRTRNLSDAADVMGLSIQKHIAWLRHWSNYKIAYDMIHEGVVIALEDALRDRSFNGFREEIYSVDDDGNEVLKGVKVKHDPQYLKTALAAEKPEVYGKEGGSGSVVVQVLVVNE